ncbi:hypothetical protein [Microbispora sp. NPDC049633]|uniref:hypothetical protein n=1 Tax=Microbispora sp. NPDC049633 TaxID=3154355 RepID=UPI0034187C4E
MDLPEPDGPMMQLRLSLEDVSRSLVDRGAERVVAACTEIVLALDASRVPVPVVDPARLLARRVAELALR